MVGAARAQDGAKVPIPHYLEISGCCATDNFTHWGVSDSTDGLYSRAYRDGPDPDAGHTVHRGLYRCGTGHGIEYSAEYEA